MTGPIEEEDSTGFADFIPGPWFDFWFFVGVLAISLVIVYLVAPIINPSWKLL